GKSVYCTADPSVNPVGGSERAGKMSPLNLKATTITDELRLSTNFQSKIIAISLKDRASILPGGHTSSGTYWLDDSLGVFMSSTFYMSRLPDWVQEFNARDLAGSYMQSGWNTLYPIHSYSQSTPDTNQYEGRFSGETNSGFPHLLRGLKKSDIRKTPYGNNLVIDFAKEAIQQEKLGQTGNCDFLTLSFSSTDYVGHQFGPNAVEVEDLYLRLDEALASFLLYLDQNIGKGQYTLFLTADHGVAHNPRFMTDRKLPAGYFQSDSLCRELNTFCKKQFGSDRLVRTVSDNYIWLNHLLLDSLGLSNRQVTESLAPIINRHDEILFAVTPEEFEKLPEPLNKMARNGYYPNRCGDILLILQSGWFEAYALTGTTHGNWNPYDTHIPMLWYGWGIEPGTTLRKTSMTDIAATLASILHIQMPSSCVGSPIPEVIRP
ncbi:MAG TPA: alkaline phosphatase family protein, partial [Chitinophagaceae bacterium]|nr:alkaline phosphatase family protein [Chitinophagaceae bacterium]